MTLDIRRARDTWLIYIGEQPIVGVVDQHSLAACAMFVADGPLLDQREAANLISADLGLVRRWIAVDRLKPKITFYGEPYFAAKDVQKARTADKRKGARLEGKPTRRT